MIAKESSTEMFITESFTVNRSTLKLTQNSFRFLTTPTTTTTRKITGREREKKKAFNPNYVFSA